MKILTFIGANISMITRAYKRRLIVHKAPITVMGGFWVPEKLLHEELGNDAHFDLLTTKMKNAGSRQNFEEILEYGQLIFYRMEKTSRELFRSRIKKVLKFLSGVFWGTVNGGLISILLGSRLCLYTAIIANFMIILIIAGIRWRTQTISRKLDNSKIMRLKHYLHRMCRNYGLLNVKIEVREKEV